MADPENLHTVDEIYMIFLYLNLKTFLYRRELNFFCKKLLTLFDQSVKCTGILCRCLCGVCTPKKSAIESQCCQEKEKLKFLLDELEKNYFSGISPQPGIHAECITKHPGFETVVLNRYTLDAAYYQYKQEHGTYRAPLYK